MDRTTDAWAGDEGAIAAFYDALAADYDGMTGFEQRFVHEKPFFRLLVERYRITSALDAGCGTGFHSLLLARLGVKVTAVDISPQMLERLEKHVSETGLPVTPVASSFADLSRKVTGKFDAVFCMGNALAHVPSPESLLPTVRSLAAVTKPGGILFLQLLNYDRILSKRERIQSVRESGGKTFVRFYDFERNRIRFNILVLERTAGGTSHKMSSADLTPVLRDQIQHALAACGCTKVETYGGISLEPFNPDASGDLVILATTS